MGLKIDEFWKMTPAELNLYIECFIKNKQNAFKENVTVAYYNAYFHRVKSMPKLKTFLQKITKPEMTDEEMFKKVLGLNKFYGGD